MMRRYSSGNSPRTTDKYFQGHYDDLKKVLDRTLSPHLSRLSPPPLLLLPPPYLTSEEDSAATETTTHPYETSQEDLSDPYNHERSVPRLRSLRFGERPLPTPRSPVPDYHTYPPSLKALPTTPRQSRLDSYPPSPRSRSNSPTKRTPRTPRTPRRRVSLSPPKTPRGGGSSSILLDPEDLNPGWMSWRSYPSTPTTRRTPRTPRSPRKSAGGVDTPSYPEVVRPPLYLDLPLSARSATSSKYPFSDEMTDDGSGSIDNGVAYYYPEDVRRMMSASRQVIPGSSGDHSKEESGGWTRREKLMLVLLLFAILTVIVLFLVVFLVVSGVLGTPNATEIYNYGQQPNASPTPLSTTHKPPSSSPSSSLPPFLTTLSPALTTTLLTGGGGTGVQTPTSTPLKTTFPKPTSRIPFSSPSSTTTTTTRNTTPAAAMKTTTTTVFSSRSTSPRGETTRTMKATTMATKGERSSSLSSSELSTTTMKSVITASTRKTIPTTSQTPTTTTTTSTTTTPTTTPPTTSTTTTTTTSTTTATTTTTTTTPKPEIVCTTEKCSRVGAAVNSSLSTEQQLCLSFYDYACGKNDKSAESSSTFSEEFSPLFNLVLEDLYTKTAGLLSQPITGAATEGEKVAKAIYASCRATNSVFDTFPAVQEMYTLFGSLGFNINLTSQLSVDVMQQTSLEQFDDGPLFRVKRVPVFDGKQYKYLPLISPPSLVLDPKVYDLSQPLRQIQEKERTYILSLSNILFSFFALNIPGDPPAGLNKDIEERMWEVLNFEKQLKQILPDETADWTRMTTETFTVSSVGQLTPSLSWSTMLNKPSTEQVQVYYKDYLETLHILLERAEEKVVKTYIFYHVLFHQAWPFVPRSLREIMHGFLLIDLPLDYSDNDCAKLTYDVAFPDTLQVLQQHGGETFVEEVEFAVATVNNLTTTLDTALESQGWMSGITRNFLIMKLSVLTVSPPEFGTRKETVSREFPSNVSTSHSLLSNAIDRLRSLVTEERILDARSFDRPKQVRFQFSPVYSMTTDTLNLPLAFVHLGSWLREQPILQPMYRYLLARSILFVFLHQETRNSWTDPSVLSLQDKISCLSDNVTPKLFSNVNPDHLTNLITAALTLQLINKDESSTLRETVTLGTNTFTDDNQLRFYLLAQVYCSGDVLNNLGHLAPDKPKADIELNFAIANDPVFGWMFGCEPGLPMAGLNLCTFWNEDTFVDYDY